MFVLEIFNRASCCEELTIHDQDAIIDIVEERSRICLTLAHDQFGSSDLAWFLMHSTFEWVIAC